MKKLTELLKNDRVQNELALCYLFEYGKQTLKDNYELGRIKDSIKQNNNSKNPIFTTDYLFETLDIARDMASFSINDLKKYIYENVKLEKKHERSTNENR